MCQRSTSRCLGPSVPCSAHPLSPALQRMEQAEAAKAAKGRQARKRSPKAPKVGDQAVVRAQRLHAAQNVDEQRRSRAHEFAQQAKEEKANALWMMKGTSSSVSPCESPQDSYVYTARSGSSVGSARPRSAGDLSHSSSRGTGRGYAGARSRDEVEAARTNALAQQGRHMGAHNRRPKSAHERFVSTGLLNLNNVAVKKSKAIPHWMAARNAREPKEGWVRHPRHATRSELREMRRKSKEAHPTFDIDGDGTVSNEDYRRSSLFDVNKDGVLQAEEQRELRRQMVAETINDYRDLQAAGAVGFDPKTEHLVKLFTQDLDKTVKSEDFGALMQKLRVRTNLCNTDNSKQIRDLLKQPRRGGFKQGLMDADADGDGADVHPCCSCWSDFFSCSFCRSSLKGASSGLDVQYHKLTLATPCCCRLHQCFLCRRNY